MENRYNQSIKVAIVECLLIRWMGGGDRETELSIFLSIDRVVSQSLQKLRVQIVIISITQEEDDSLLRLY